MNPSLQILIMNRVEGGGGGRGGGIMGNTNTHCNVKLTSGALDSQGWYSTAIV